MHFFETFRIRNESKRTFFHASRKLYHYYVVLSMHAIWRRRGIYPILQMHFPIFFLTLPTFIRKRYENCDVRLILRQLMPFSNFFHSKPNETKYVHVSRVSKTTSLLRVLLHYTRDLMLPQNIQCYRCTSRYFSNITDIYMRII